MIGLNSGGRTANRHKTIQWFLSGAIVFPSFMCLYVYWLKKLRIGELTVSKDAFYLRKFKTYNMEDQLQNLVSPTPLAEAKLKLGSETYSIDASKGVLSEQLVSVKEQTMSILKDYITKNSVPNDVPDEPEEISSDDDGEIPAVKSKKRK